MRQFTALALTILFVSAMGPAWGETRYQTVAGAGGVPLLVASAGDPQAPALLFVHGVGQSHFAFHRQFEADLASDYHLITFDLRGHGASGKPWATEAYGSAAVWADDIAAVLDATGARRPLLVGWSFGSLVVLDYLRERGVEQAAGVLLTGAIGGLVPLRLPPADDALTAEFMLVRQQQLSNDPRQQVAALDRMVRWLTSAPVTEEERQVLKATAAMFPAYARRAIYSRRVDNTDLPAALADTPLLLALGSEDNAALLEDAAVFAAERDNVELSMYEGAGHSVFLEQAERFNDELRAFASRVFSAPRPADPEGD